LKQDVVEAKDQFIIAIGYSAGGLAPLKGFFDCTPLDDVTYVVLSHLSMDFTSEMKNILSKHSLLEIKEAEDGMSVERNKIYVLPSKKIMRIGDGKLILYSRYATALYPNWAINIFMESLAEERGDKSIGVILSGSGTDGVKGVHCIKQAGGMVLAQTPQSSQHPSMPDHAIQAGDVDFVLLPEEMPAVIQHYVKKQYPLSAGTTTNTKK